MLAILNSQAHKLTSDTSYIMLRWKAGPICSVDVARTCTCLHVLKSKNESMPFVAEITSFAGNFLVLFDWLFRQFMGRISNWVILDIVILVDEYGMYYDFLPEFSHLIAFFSETLQAPQTF